MNEPARPVGGRSTNAAGQPVQMFEKVLIRAGDWYHPGTGESIPVDAKRLSHWAESFDKMAKAGVPVPVPVDHTRNPAANRGWVKSMRVEGDSLIGTIEVIGEDAIKMVARVDCSISIRDRLADAYGTDYIDVIEHVALVADPAMPGLGEFVAIELSRAKQLGLARSMKMESLLKIAEKLGLATEGMDEAALLAAIMEKVGTMAMPDVVDASKAEADAAKKELAAAQEQVKALKLSAGKPVEVDPDVIDVGIRHVKSRAESLAKDGKITPAVRNKLESALVGSASNPHTICLSRKAATAAGFPAAIADMVLDALEDMPVKSDAAGKGGRTDLSRNVPGKGKADDIDPDFEDRVARAFGKKRK